MEITKETRSLICGGTRKRTNSSSSESTSSSSDGMITCHFTKNVMKRDLDSSSNCSIIEMPLKKMPSIANLDQIEAPSCISLFDSSKFVFPAVKQAKKSDTKMPDKKAGSVDFGTADLWPSNEMAVTDLARDYNNYSDDNPSETLPRPRRVTQSLFESDLIDWDRLRPGTSGLQRNIDYSLYKKSSVYDLTDSSSEENINRTTLYRK